MSWLSDDGLRVFLVLTVIILVFAVIQQRVTSGRSEEA